MTQSESEDQHLYIVLINEEEQYSLWRKDIKIPAGWSAVGPEGNKAECMKYVDEVWTDMRPLSLRRSMAAASDTQPPASPNH